MAVPAKLKARLKKIKMLILDIDGVLTDARILWIEGTGWTASGYNVRDGFGIRQLMKNGIEVAMISGGAFASHKKRAEVLKVTHAYFGDEDKIHAYEKIKADTGYSDAELAYVGDELFDIPVLEKVGFSATVADAAPQVKKRVHLTTKQKGGFGAAREICDLLLEAQGKLPK